MTTPKPRELVGPGEVARALGVPRNTVAQWRHRGLLPAPIAELDDGRRTGPRGESPGLPVWRWSDIERWARETGRL